MNRLPTTILRASGGDDEALSSLALLPHRGRLEVSEIADIATAIAGSGVRLGPHGRPTIDFASTGGTGSLSTLLCPLMLRAEGLDVACLGVPGRPAGAMDALATIPGFRTRASGSEASAWLARAGHCHIQAGGDFAPLDILLFRRRQQLGTQAAPDLVVASLLGKKLAMGLDTGVVEIRVGVHGNFGSTVEEARANALLLIAVADELGINCRVFIQSSPRLQQPWIGRGEALLALQCVASSECEESLARHAAYCWRLVKMVLRTNAAQPSADRIRACLGDHLRVQGSDLDALAVRVQAIAEAPRIPLLASHDGFFEPDVAALRSALVELQAMEPGDYPDAAGVQMLLLGGEQVRAGQELCLVRTESASNERAVKSIERAMVVRAHPRSLPCSDEVLEVCDGG